MDSSIIQTNNLTRRFDDLVAVDNIDVSVPKGKVYGFLGPNGSGKTTTVRMLLGLIKPNSGSVTLFGDDLKENRENILRKIGALIENPSLYPHLKGKENLAIYQKLLGLPKANIDYALDIVKMNHASNKLVKTYSLGMKQRLALALALLQKPRLLILDEPTNGLDPSGIIEMRELLKEMSEGSGITVFLCFHYLSEVEQVADSVGIISKGKILFQGTLESLYATRKSKLILDVDMSEDAVKLIEKNGWQSVCNNGSIEVSVSNKSEVPDINKLLVEEGIQVFHLNILKPNLESIFLDVTKEA